MPVPLSFLCSYNTRPYARICRKQNTSSLDEELWQKKGKYKEQKKKIDWRKGVEKFKEDRDREEREE